LHVVVNGLVTFWLISTSGRHLNTCHKTKGYKTLRHECERHETWDLGNDDNAMVETGNKIEKKNYFGISSQMS
jgi:hypothetical protein